MRRSPIAVSIAVGLAITTSWLASSAFAAQARDPEQVFLNSKDVKWGAPPPAVPKGAKIAVLYGDPMAAGPFVMRVMVPSNYKLPPHWHSHPQQVTVLSGALYIKTYDDAGNSREQAIKAGGFVRLPAKARQNAYTKSATVIEVHADGPWELNYVNPNDDPSKWAQGKPYYFPSQYEDSERKAKAEPGAATF